MYTKGSMQSFNDYEKFGKIDLNSSTRTLGEKIKLEFSVEISNKYNMNNSNDIFYSIQAKLYDKQVFDYISEEKKITNYPKIIFDKILLCDFFFEKEQKLVITLNINDKRYKTEKNYNFNTTLGCIISSPTFRHKCSENESILIKAEKMEQTDDLLNLNFVFKESSNLKQSNYFYYNKIYFDILSNNKQLYESSEIKSDGTFEPNYIPICLLNPFYTVRFFNSNKQMIVSFNKSIQEIKTNNGKLQSRIQLINNGYLELYDYSIITKNYTFLDYIRAGVKIALSIGIDFTGSNGHPLDEISLHSIKQNVLNDYEKAILSCGNIVAYYDYDQLFPVYGFGAIINSSFDKKVSMCFNLNFTNNPDIHTIDNVIKIYRDCIQREKLTFSGPTEFTPLINEVISRIKKNDPYEYHILMILTDGIIDDMQRTTDTLVEASLLPLSVIIIGIGNENFKDMETLDGDKVPIVSSSGKKRMRDLVQFVPFSKFQNNAQQLTMEVLAEIPRQIVEYFQFKNLNPDKIKNLIFQKSQMKASNYNSNIKYNNIPNINNIYNNQNQNRTGQNNNNYQNYNQNNCYTQRNYNYNKNKYDMNINQTNKNNYIHNQNNNNNLLYDNLRSNNNNIRNNNALNNNNNKKEYPSFEELKRQEEIKIDNLPINETVYLNK